MKSSVTAVGILHFGRCLFNLHRYLKIIFVAPVRQRKQQSFIQESHGKNWNVEQKEARGKQKSLPVQNKCYPFTSMPCFEGSIKCRLTIILVLIFFPYSWDRMSVTWKTWWILCTRECLSIDTGTCNYFICCRYLELEIKVQGASWVDDWRRMWISAG